MKARAVLDVDAGNAQAQALQKRAQKILDDQTTAKARQNQIKVLLKAAQDAFDGNDYSGAVVKARAVLDVDAGNTQAQALQKQAQEKLEEKRQEHDYQAAMTEGASALADGKAAMTAGNAAQAEPFYDKAIAQAKAALVIHNNSREAAVCWRRLMMRKRKLRELSIMPTTFKTPKNSRLMIQFRQVNILMTRHA